MDMNSGAAAGSPTATGSSKTVRRALPGSEELLGVRFYTSLIAVSLVLGLITRVRFFGAPGFPLGEGGLFVHFTQLILDNSFRLPDEAVYGGVTIPFAYPPAAFYVAAAAQRLSGADLHSVFYWMPILFNLGAIPAFAFLSSRVVRSRAAVAAATILYVQVVHSFLWQITGGGLPRAMAAIIAMTAVGLAFDSARRSGWIRPVITGLLVGLTILTHLEWGIFAAIGVTLAILCSGISRGNLLKLVASGAVAAAVISPWIAAIVVRHGFAPFLSSSAASEFNFTNFMFDFLAAHFMGLLVWPAVIGIFFAVKQRLWFPLLWIPLILLLTPRMGTSAGVAIPVAILAGFGVAHAAKAFVRMIENDPQVTEAGRHALGSGRMLGLSIPAMIILLAMSAILGSTLRTGTADLSTMKQLSPEERLGMAWIRNNTPPQTEFVIVSPGIAWWADRQAEWFPVLANRASLTTAQGLEWAGPGAFTDRKRQVDELKMVQLFAPEAMPQRIAKNHCHASVAAFLPDDHKARAELLRSPLYRQTYINKNVAIFAPTNRARCGS